MQTKNNVQKAITKTLAVIISLVLISITVNAQDFWKTVFEKSSFNHIALALAEDAETQPAPGLIHATTGSFSHTFVLTDEAEEKLEVEDWMMSSDNFYTSVFIGAEVEAGLEMENWMTDETLFDVYAPFLKVETEEALELEGWMHNTANFEVQTIDLETEMEEALELEAWMTDNTIW